MFIALLLPFIPLIVVPVGLAFVFRFRHAHGCDACTAQSYNCARHETGKDCPFFD